MTLNKLLERVGDTDSILPREKSEHLAIKLKFIFSTYKPDFEHLKIMTKEAQKLDLNLTLMAALIANESSFRKDVKHYNRAGSMDYGYFQLNNKWHKQHIGNYKAHIKAGAEHLKWCLKVNGNNEAKALSQYNTGSPNGTVGAAYAQRVFKIKKDIDRQIYKPITRDMLGEGIEDAEKFAEKQHEGQTRRDGSPYVAHPKRVMGLVQKYKQSHKIDELMKAALLHDTIEDTKTTEEDLKKMFGGLVASLVRELTSDKKEVMKQGKANYLTKKMINMTDWALVIKLSDRLDNVNDLETTDKKFRDKYTKETYKILNTLEKQRKLTGSQKRLINAIRDKLIREL